MTGDWLAHVLWFGFGFTTCLVMLLGVAPVMLSGRISRDEERRLQERLPPAN